MKQKFVKYLADYIRQEDQEMNESIFWYDNLESIISEGFDAFESTEDCKIISEDNSPELRCPKCGNDDFDVVEGGVRLIRESFPDPATVVFHYQCSCGQFVNKIFYRHKVEAVK